MTSTQSGAKGARRRLERAAFTAAATAYTANVALGVGVRSGAVDSSGFRWVHHALYIATCALSAGAASSAVWGATRAGVLAVPAAVPLALIPRRSARSTTHIVLGLAVAPFLLGGLRRAWSSSPSQRTHTATCRNGAR